MKKIIFYIFIGIIAFPALQRQFNFFTFQELSGSFTSAKDISFSFSTWFNGEYQSKKENYIKENIGFRPMFVRVYNQLLYSFFKEANNPGGVVGDNNYLYLESYIYNQTGENYIGDKKILRISSRLKYLQDYFEERGITLLTVFVPSKASYFPEYIPSQYKTFPKSNYSAYLQAFDSLNIQYIDINKYLISLKGKTKYPLYSRNGLHWTSYGMALGMDSVLSKIEQIRNIDLPDFSWKEPVPMSAKNTLSDNDAESLMNLYFDLPRELMPYPEFIYNTDSTKGKPKTIVIGDSYYLRAYRLGIPKEVFSWGGYWYYFNTAKWQENGKKKQKALKNMDVGKLLLQNDIIILFASQATLHRYPFNFTSRVFPLYMPKDEESLIKYYTDNLYYNTKGLEVIQKKADVNHFSLEEQVNRDAAWLTRKYLKEHPFRGDTIK